MFNEFPEMRFLQYLFLKMQTLNEFVMERETSIVQQPGSMWINYFDS